MRIALHTPFVVNKNTGIARHLLGLLRGLAEYEPPAADIRPEYFCFWPPEEPWPDWLGPSFHREPFPLADQNPILRVLRERRWLYQAHRRLGFDLVHSPFGYLPSRLPCPSVVTVHDCRWARYPRTFTRLRGAFLRRAIPASIGQARFTIAISEETRREITRLVPSAPPDRLRVLYPGLDPFWHEPVSEDSRRLLREKLGPARFLLAVGTHEPHKNLPNLLRAFARFKADKREFSDLRLYLVGVKSFATGHHDDLTALMYHLGLEDSVRPLGAVDDLELKAAYAEAEALCFPSYYEGFGYPPLEAMAVGTPVIASDASCIPEVVGDAAELADPYSVESLAGAMERVLTEPELKQALIARGVVRSRCFPWKAHASGVEQLYREALKK